MGLICARHTVRATVGSAHEVQWRRWLQSKLGGLRESLYIFNLCHKKRVLGTKHRREKG